MTEDGQAGQGAAYPPITGALAEFAAGLSLSRLDDATALTGSCCLLDWLGCVIAGNADAGTMPYRAYAEAQGALPVAAMLGTATASSAELAALVNGSAAHLLDFDDTHFGMYGHPSAAVIAAAFAVAEREGSDGTALLEAMVAGVEATCRLGRMLGYDIYLKGFTPASNSGAIGATIAAARLTGAGSGRIGGAIGLAASCAAGLHCNVPTDAAYLQIGAAAAAGVRAADLARLGTSARPDVLECKMGLVQSRSGRPNWDHAIGDRNRAFEIETIVFKFHAACGGAQAGIDAAREARKAGILPDDIEAITVTVSPTVNRLCRFDSPASGPQTKLSLPFCVAAGLLGRDTTGNALWSETEIADPGMAGIMRRVTVRRSGDIGEWETRLEIRLKDGRERIFEARADLPVTDREVLWSRLAEKFVALTGPSIGAGRARRVAEMVRSRQPAKAISAALVD